VGDELVKVSLMSQSTADVVRVIRAVKETADVEKTVLCMGRFGTATRILAEKLGSQICYAGITSEKDVPLAAPGQLDVRELNELYRFRAINGDTKVYGVVGYPLAVSGSPRFFNAVFGLENTNAVYVPFPADSIASFMELAEELALDGVSVTVPYKERILPFLGQKSAEVQAIGACNTITRFAGGWLGTNTDARGFSDSLLAFIGKKNFRRQKITIIGAGGAARALAWEIHRLGGKALILNRTVLKARELAAPYNFQWGGLDIQGFELLEKYSDIIVQTTPAGMAGNADTDPLEICSFSGREIVMDLVYKPDVTPFLTRAAAAGCRILNGYDMLIRQARYQYAHFMGKEFPEQLMSRVAFG
jgi:3-dehydroquinate dehydratase/shikimate dehydrogenase